MAVKPIPDGYHSATPYFMVADAAKAIAFYQQAFGAVELFRMPDPTSGRIGHAEIKVGDSILMLADEWPQSAMRSPATLGGTSVGICLYVPDVDAQYQKALDAGAKAVRPVQDQFYGDRSGQVLDPFGHLWTIATHKEDVSPDEMNRRFETFMKQHAK